MKLRNTIRNAVLILWTMAGLAFPAPQQDYPTNFELTCPAGSIPGSGNGAVSQDPSTGKYRAVICYNPSNGTSTWNDATSSGSSGVTSFDGRTGAVLPLLDDYESLLLTNGATLDSTFAVTDSAGATISDVSGTLVFTSPALNTITFGSGGATLSSGNYIAARFQSSVATGTAPFIVTSTTNVPNLNASSLNGATFAAPGAIGGTTPNTGRFTTLTETAIWITNAVPTISSGFGTTPSVTTNNGSIAFKINVGTGGTASSGVIALNATATHDWLCSCTDTTTKSTSVSQCQQTPGTLSSTTASITNYSDVSVATAWVASDVVAVTCVAE